VFRLSRARPPRLLLLFLLSFRSAHTRADAAAPELTHVVGDRARARDHERTHLFFFCGSHVRGVHFVESSGKCGLYVLDDASLHAAVLFHRLVWGRAPFRAKLSLGGLPPSSLASRRRPPRHTHIEQVV